MLYLILTIGIMLVLLDRTIRGSRIRLLKLELEFRLFALRDELRLDAIREESPYNNWFDYMDTTLTRTISRLDSVNPWYAVAFIITHRNDAYLFRVYQMMREALRQENNRRIERIYDQYNETISQFVRKRFPVSWFFAALLFVLLYPEEHIHQSIEEEERKLTPVFSIAPATSTLREHAQTMPASSHHAHHGSMAPA